MSAADPLPQIFNKIKCTLQKKNQKIIRFIIDNNERPCGSECDLHSSSFSRQQHVIMIGCVVTLSHAWVAECHRKIWLQSGYNLANNPAYNRNQTRP
jgi:hypothetical protein